jgi:predicted nucleic acid-binding protein
MTMPTVDRVLLDTNVLLAATDEARVEHEVAMRALNDWPRAGIALYTSGQILREYLAVATRPGAQNGLGLSRDDALHNVHSLRGRLTLLAEDQRVHDRLVDLVGSVDCTGKQVHDANVAATMLVHGVENLVTMNIADFARFQPRITLLPLVSTE